MEELDLKELISIFMKRKVLIILVVIIFALLGAIYTTKFITPTYQSETSVVLVRAGSEDVRTDTTNSTITTSDLTLNSKMVDNYKAIAVSRTALTRVIEKLNLDMTVKELKSIISISTKSDTEIIEITVTYTEPEMARSIAKEVAKSFIDRANEIYTLQNLQIMDEANINYEPSNVHLGKNIVIFAFVGGILVSGYILLINMLDTTVKSDTDIERALNVPVLASIVLTNENAKKNVQNQADNIYKFSGFDHNEGQQHSLDLDINNQNDSLFENYTPEELPEIEELVEEPEPIVKYDKPNKDYYRPNNNHKGRNKKNRNRRNGK